MRRTFGIAALLGTLLTAAPAAAEELCWITKDVEVPIKIDTGKDVCVEGTVVDPNLAQGSDDFTYACKKTRLYLDGWKTEKKKVQVPCAELCVGAERVFESRGRCYGFFAGKTTYDKAAAKCKAWGGMQATVRDATDNKNLLSDLNQVWIGLDDKITEGKFKWVTGEALSYTNWASGEPNNDDSGEDCAHLYPGNGEWNDGECGQERAETMCMKESE